MNPFLKFNIKHTDHRTGITTTDVITQDVFAPIEPKNKNIISKIDVIIDGKKKRGKK